MRSQYIGLTSHCRAHTNNWVTIAEQVVEQCLATRLRKANRLITNIYDQALRPLGLKISQMNILVVTEKKGAARPSEIGRALDIEASTLSRNLERMRRRGWIEALEDESDARSQPFRLTSEGRRLIEDAYPAWLLAQDKAQRLLGAEAAAALGKSPAAALADDL